MRVEASGLPETSYLSRWMPKASQVTPDPRQGGNRNTSGRFQPGAFAISTMTALSPSGQRERPVGRRPGDINEAESMVAGFAPNLVG